MQTSEKDNTTVFNHILIFPSRPVFKPFAASIPSLRPAPADTDTDSVDSVEAAIQAAMKKKGKNSCVWYVKITNCKKVKIQNR